MNRVHLVALALVLVSISGAAACGSSAPETATPTKEPGGAVGRRVETSGGSYTDVTPTELRSMLERTDVILVNVHIPYEGEIDGTDLFIPYDQIDRRLEDLPQRRDVPIVVYCRSGRMSAIAAEALVREGYTNVWNLAGGMEAWRDAGLPIVTEANPGGPGVPP